MKPALIILTLLAAAFVPFSCSSTQIRIGSKAFTGSVVLGELATLMAESDGTPVLHYAQLGGTRLVYEAVRNGEIDLYPEYTGTLANEIFAGRVDSAKPLLPQLDVLLAEDGLAMTKKLGFSDNYALGMREDVAERLDIKTISDLKSHPELVFRFGNEFMERADDGWPSLKQRYSLPQTDVKGMDHDLAFRQLRDNAVQVMDVYTAEAKIKSFNLRVLEDDLEFFPSYDAVLVYRRNFAIEQPNAFQQIAKLEAAISQNKMLELNVQAETPGQSEKIVAANFLAAEFDTDFKVAKTTRMSRVAKTTLDHFDLVRKSLIVAILIAIPLGIYAAWYPSVGQFIIGFAGIMQTIPGLALLVILMQPVNAIGLGSLGQGSAAVIIALFLYSLLPIVRNTFTGLQSISPQLTEVGESLGLSRSARLRLIDLPMASPTILAGIKTAAVMNVGFATLGAFIGAGGYGQPILTGIRRNDYSMILEGAIPAAIFALLTQAAFELCERWLVPQGLRLKAGE